MQKWHRHSNKFVIGVFTLIEMFYTGSGCCTCPDVMEGALSADQNNTVPVFLYTRTLMTKSTTSMGMPIK